jgi:hypothetical protein
VTQWWGFYLLARRADGRNNDLQPIADDIPAHQSQRGIAENPTDISLAAGHGACAFVRDSPPGRRRQPRNRPDLSGTGSGCRLRGPLEI